MKKFTKFCIVGFCNTAITLMVYLLLFKIAGINYLISSILGYLAGILNSFIMNKRWTFHDKDGRILIQFTKFSIINGISLGVNLSILYTCVEWLGMGKLLSQLVAIGFSTVANYTGSRILVFHEKHRDIENEEILSYLK